MKRCRRCGEKNTDDRIFCAACGEPLDADLQLVMDLKKKGGQERRAEPVHKPRDEDEELFPRAEQEEKKAPVGLICGIALAVIAIAAVVFLLT